MNDAQRPGAPIGHLKLQVEAMGCRRCVREVTALLRDVRGVEMLIPEIEAATVDLYGDMTPDDVLAALDGTAYLAHLIEEP